jgi:enamine deaminase RidA (YjgF/YER057c/UK114 family)
MAKVIHPEGWAAAKGYANGVVAEGKILFVGGQIGWNKDKVFETDDFVGQVRQTLENIVAVVEATGGKVENITRMTWFIKDKQVYNAYQKELGKVYRDVLGRHFPAMSLLVVADLLEDKAQVEIEATAVLE